MKKLWFGALIVVVASFGVLGWIGSRIYQEMPPIPDRVVTTDGTDDRRRGEIGRGQNVWQALGGMEVGSIWGHGSYVAPDWTADWLHREAVFVLDEWARPLGSVSYEQLPPEQQGALHGTAPTDVPHQHLRSGNRDDSHRPGARPGVTRTCLAHYSDVFMKGETGYAIPAGTVSDAEQMQQLAAFIFWTAWAASTNRPGDSDHLHHNWPHEPLVGNRPTGEAVMWTGVSIIMLLARHLRHGGLVRLAEA